MTVDERNEFQSLKPRRFRPALVAVGAMFAIGSGVALYFGIKSDSEKLTVDQIATTKKNLYVMPRAEQLPSWRKLAETGPVELQQEALAQLYFLRDKELVPLASKALHHVDHRVRGVAAQVLAAVGLPDGESARPALLKAFKEAETSDRPQLAWALTVFNEKRVWKDVLTVYRSGQLATIERPGGGRSFDVETLGNLASADEWTALAGDPSDSVRGLAARVLSRTADRTHLATLIKLVNDPKNDVARDAASGLGRIGDAAALQPLVAALTRADKDDRQRFLEALRDGVGGRGLVLALGSVSKETPERTKFQTKQMFDSLRQLADPRAADALVAYIGTNPLPHWKTEAALRLAEVGDVRAAGFLGDRMKLDPLKLYDGKSDPEYTRDDNERVVAARMLADLAVLHPEAKADLRAKAEDGVLFWCKDRPQPHANGLRFLAAVESKKVLPDLRKWALPSVALPKAGQAGAFPLAYETAPSALRYLGWTKESWGTLEQQLNRKEARLDITDEGLMGAGLSMLGMVLRGLAVGAAQGFAQWGDARAYPLLTKFAEDPKQNEGARLEACRAMAWVGSEENLRELAKKAQTLNAADSKGQLLRACYLEALLRKPVIGTAPALLEMMRKEVDVNLRHLVARALGWPGLDAPTEQALFEKMKDPDLKNDAALALILGGSEDAAARAVALFNNGAREALDDLKDLYFESFSYWSEDDITKARVPRFVANAEAIARVRVNDTPQDWGRLRLGAQLATIEFDTGPHSVTRVVLRARLMDTARKGETAAKRGAIQTLQFMKEQGSLMALRDDKGETGMLARRSLFELLNPKTVMGETVPEKKPVGDSVRIVPGK